MESALEVCVSFGGEIESYRFARLPVRFGRDASNDLVLPYAFVSRHHGRIDSTSGELAVVDHGSRNGVLVRGKRVKAHDPTKLDSARGEFSIDCLTVSVSVAAQEANDTLPLVAPDTRREGLPSQRTPPSSAC